MRFLRDVHFEFVVDAGGDGAIHLHGVVCCFVLDLLAARCCGERSLSTLPCPCGVLCRALIRLCIARHGREVRVTDALDLRPACDTDHIVLRHHVAKRWIRMQGNPRPVRHIGDQGEFQCAEVAFARLRVDAAPRVEVRIARAKEAALLPNGNYIRAVNLGCQRRARRAGKASLRIGVQFIAELGIILRSEIDARVRLCGREIALYDIDAVRIGHGKGTLHHGKRNNTRRFDVAGGLGCALCAALRGDPRIARCLCTAVLKCDLCRLRHVRGDLARIQRARAVAARRVLVRVVERILRLVVLRTDRLDLRVLYGDNCVLSERLCQLRAAAADDCRLKCVDIVYGIVIGGCLGSKRTRRTPRPHQLRLRRKVCLVVDARCNGAECSECATAAVRYSRFQCFAARHKRSAMEHTAARRTIENGVAAEDVVDRAEVCRRSKETTRR